MKYIIIILNLLFISSLLSTTWVINQDGSGHFTFIAVGIMVAQDGDTILVHPGVYYENLNYEGKNITITSLYDGDQYDESYIANTVIDGSHSGTVIVFDNNETRNAVLNGFTIRHGEGIIHSGDFTQGGGIYISDASPTISNCYITANRAAVGGAICAVFVSNPLLKGNRIHNNRSFYGGAVSGGGINTNIEFCSVSLNSVYLNFSGVHADIRLGGANQSPVVIDTLTVLHPDTRFVGFNSRNLPDDFTFTVNHGKIEPVEADLYISPYGCDNNSGLSPDEPLKTISWALIKIAPDSLIQRTIHVAEGVYSRSLNNQQFPVGGTSFVNIIGANKETTILDMEGETYAFHIFSSRSTVATLGEGFSFIKNYTIKNFTIINGGNPLCSPGVGAIIKYFNSHFTLENIDIYNCHTGSSDSLIGGNNTVSILHSHDFTVRNLHVYNCSGQRAVKISSGFDTPTNYYLENVRIRNNVPGPFNPDYAGGFGGGMMVRSTSFDDPIQPLNATLVNIEVTDCVINNRFPPWATSPTSQLFFTGPAGLTRLINATIGNNYSPYPYDSGIGFWASVNYELINSIVYGNLPHEILIWAEPPYTCYLTVSHSLINGGQDGIYLYGNPNAFITWGEGNINANPLWIGEVLPDYPHEYPYMLHRNSPARNAGTLDIPGFEFPEYDLAGNPRISGSSIDMGAYEYQEMSHTADDEIITDLSVHDYKLYNYPNPVTSLQGMGAGRGVGTTISFVLPQEGEAAIDIYNLKGQFVKRVFNAKAPAGEYNVLWNGTDEQGRVVATGFYMYRLMINGKQVAAGRCTFIK